MKSALVVCLLAVTTVPVTPHHAPADPGTAEADRLLQRHVEALGGEKVLSRITSRQCEGSVERHGRSVPIVTYARSPNLARIETRFPKPGTLIQGFDGTAAWVLHPLQGLRRLEARETAAFASQSWLHPALHIAETYAVRRWVETGTRDGVEIAVLALGRDDKRLETWRFDAATARLLEIERKDDMGIHGEVSVVVRFEDYRTVDGVTLPFTVRTRVPLFETVLRLDHVRHNLPLDDALFALPAERAGR
jgi:hypothetical protein